MNSHFFEPNWHAACVSYGMIRQTWISLTAVVALAGTARGDTPAETKTSSGTVSEYVPGKTLAIQEESDLVTYRPASQVTFVDRRGKDIPEERARERIRAGMKVTVQYVMQGGDRVFHRLEFGDDDGIDLDIEAPGVDVEIDPDQGIDVDVDGNRKVDLDWGKR